MNKLIMKKFTKIKQNSIFIIFILFSLITSSLTSKTSFLKSSTKKLVNNTITTTNQSIYTNRSLRHNKKYNKINSSHMLNSTNTTNTTSLSNDSIPKVRINNITDCEALQTLNQKAYDIKQLINSTLADYKSHLKESETQQKAIKVENEIGFILLNIRKLDGTLDNLHDLTKDGDIVSKDCNIVYLKNNIKNANIHLENLLNLFKTHLSKLNVKYLFSVSPKAKNQLVFAQITEKSTNNYETKLNDERLITLLVNDEVDKHPNA